MSIPLHLLKPYPGALGFITYGGPGTRKTNAIHTLPPPIWHADMEQGNASVIPWTRRTRHWDSHQWTDLTDEDRQAAYDKLNKANKDYIQKVTKIVPRPFIDTVFYDNMNPFSFKQFTEDIIAMDTDQYNAIALDAAPEFSELVRTAIKGKDNELKAFNPKHWPKVQDETAAAVRYLRNYRSQGVFLYFTSSEIIDKDYVTDPRSQDPNAREEPISIKGNLNMYGKLIPLMQHAMDCQFHTSVMNGSVTWMSRNEPIAIGSTVQWEAKDRTGRLPDHGVNQPNFRWILKEIFGEERQKEIYAAARSQSHSA